MSGRRNNSDSKTVNLYDLKPELTEEDVSLYLEAVYTNRVAAKYIGTSESKVIGTLYVVAEQMMDVQTRNLTLQAMYERIRESAEDGKYSVPVRNVCASCMVLRQPPQILCVAF
jgi:hypothetical protein